MSASIDVDCRSPTARRARVSRETLARRVWAVTLADQVIEQVEIATSTPATSTSSAAMSSAAAQYEIDADPGSTSTTRQVRALSFEVRQKLSGASPGDIWRGVATAGRHAGGDFAAAGAPEEASARRERPATRACPARRRLNARSGGRASRTPSSTALLAAVRRQLGAAARRRAQADRLVAYVRPARALERAPTTSPPCATRETMLVQHLLDCLAVVAAAAAPAARAPDRARVLDVGSGGGSAGGRDRRDATPELDGRRASTASARRPRSCARRPASLGLTNLQRRPCAGRGSAAERRHSTSSPRAPLRRSTDFVARRRRHLLAPSGDLDGDEGQDARRRDRAACERVRVFHVEPCHGSGVERRAVPGLDATQA